MTKLFALVAALPLVLLAAAPDPPAPQAAPATPSAPVASLDAVRFLAGTWRGSMGEDFVEEMWSEPHGQSVMGSFRWLRPNGTPVLFEMLLITKEPDALRLRLRHYTATLDAKDEKPMTLKLAEAAPNRAVFSAEKDADGLDRIVYERRGDVLAIDVEFVQPTGPDVKPREPLRFQLKRAS
ncbi:MAG: hypothetical protein JNM94_10875 [Phycisphaerae bacterium]|nr:hypothetical protein [Phycisphaerae bacterium]